MGRVRSSVVSPRAHFAFRNWVRFLFRRLTLLLLLCGGPSIACGPVDHPAPPAITLVDDAGDSLLLRAPARRIVSLLPSTTELLFAIGAGSSVVGRTTWCDYPAAARAVPDLGDGIAPNLEAILGANPDLVLLYDSPQNGGVAERLRASGIAVARLHNDLLSDVPRLARMLGTMTATDSAAAAVAQAFEAALASLPPRSDSPVRVMLLVWDQPPMTVGRGSFLTELVARAGGRNVFDDIAASSAQIAIEAAVARDPDVMLLLGGGPPAFAGRPEWQAVPAVRDRRFVVASGSEYQRPSPRAPAAIRALHERFSAVSR